MFQRGAEVKVVPWNYDYSQEEFDGLFISNGPGDPSLATDAIQNLRKVISKKWLLFASLNQIEISGFHCFISH